MTPLPGPRNPEECHLYIATTGSSRLILEYGNAPKVFRQSRRNTGPPLRNEPTIGGREDWSAGPRAAESFVGRLSRPVAADQLGLTQFRMAIRVRRESNIDLRQELAERHLGPTRALIGKRGSIQH